MTKSLLEIEVANDFVISNGINGFYSDNMLYNEAAGGLFMQHHETGKRSLVFKSNALRNFAIAIAVIKSGYTELVLNIVANNDRVYCTKIQPGLYLQNGYKVPAEFLETTALVMCLRSDLYEFNLNVKLFGSPHGTIWWTLPSPIISESLKNEGQFEKEHNEYRRCPECLVISTNGSGHKPPCPPLHTASLLRENIFSCEMNQMFQIRFENPNEKIQILNEEGTFMDLSSDMILHNDIIGGVFCFKNLASSGKTVLTYTGIEARRFTILFAFFRKGKLRIRFSLVFTREYGCFGFKVTKTAFPEIDGTFKIPVTWDANTVLFFAIQPKNCDVDVAIRLFTEPRIEGQISYDFARDEINLSDSLLPSKAKRCQYPEKSSNNPSQQFQRSQISKTINDQILQTPTYVLNNAVTSIQAIPSQVTSTPLLSIQSERPSNVTSPSIPMVEPQGVPNTESLEIPNDGSSQASEAGNDHNEVLRRRILMHCVEVREKLRAVFLKKEEKDTADPEFNSFNYWNIENLNSYKII